MARSSSPLTPRPAALLDLVDLDTPAPRLLVRAGRRGAGAVLADLRLPVPVDSVGREQFLRGAVQALSGVFRQGTALYLSDRVKPYAW